VRCDSSSPQSGSHPRVSGAAAGVVDDWFASQPDLPVDRIDRAEGAWFTVLAGERKRTIPVYLELGAQHLSLQSFFLRAPDENAAGLYHFLLRRNLRSHVLRFALAEEGDVLIVGLLPRAALLPDELDRVLGQLLLLADEAFNPALRLGFGSYIERERAWRQRVGAPPNPVG
jgi:hypothetical protein